MLDISHLCLRFDKAQGHTVLNDFSLHLEAGEIACILGASGSGKTSLLRIIAGFLEPNSGSVAINHEKVVGNKLMTAVEQRGVGVVFQDFALFPHLSVLENVAYGLRQGSKQQKQQTALGYIDLVGLSGQAHKYPYQLSGGQQQRVAIARAIAPQPRLLLLDEPFSSLDPALREHLATEIRQIIKQQGITALMITHDQTEAFSMADKIGVLEQGYCQQWGTAFELYHQPSTPFVANFIGEGTFIDGVIQANDDKHWTVVTQLGDFVLGKYAQFSLGQDVKLLVRPDDLIHDDKSLFKAQVISRAFRGSHILYRLRLGIDDETVLCLAPSHHDHGVGESFGIRLDLDHVICFASETVPQSGN